MHYNRQTPYSHLLSFVIPSRTPVDIDARRDRYECNITTYSPASNAVELVERVANEISREDIQIYSALITSGTVCTHGG